jgi:hypothetical protein
MSQSIIRPTIVAPGVFLLPRLRPDGRLVEVDLKPGGVPASLPRLAAIDHGGRFVCLCGDDRACREHDLSFLERAAAGWWAGPMSGDVGGYFQPFIRPHVPFALEVTLGDAAGIIPIDRNGMLGPRLKGLNAQAWRGPRLRVFAVVGTEPDGNPVCSLGLGVRPHCDRCKVVNHEQSLCSHLQLVVEAGSASVRRGAVPPPARGASQRRERVEVLEALRESGERLTVCNDPTCRSLDFAGPCAHAREEWLCPPAAALDMGHSHKAIDTVMSRGGRAVVDSCERWGDSGVAQRDAAKHFCGPRPLESAAPCGRRWVLESREGMLTIAWARYSVTVHRRVCAIQPGRMAACCSLAYDGQVRVRSSQSMIFVGERTSMTESIEEPKIARASLARALRILRNEERLEAMGTLMVKSGQNCVKAGDYARPAEESVAKVNAKTKRAKAARRLEFEKRLLAFVALQEHVYRERVEMGDAGIDDLIARNEATREYIEETQALEPNFFKSVYRFMDGSGAI